jgi:hypothetical protein
MITRKSKMNRRKFLKFLTGLLAALPFVRLGKTEPDEAWGPGPVQQMWDDFRRRNGGLGVDWNKIKTLPWDLRGDQDRIDRLAEMIYDAGYRSYTTAGCSIFEWNPDIEQWEQVLEWEPVEYEPLAFDGLAGHITGLESS